MHDAMLMHQNEYLPNPFLARLTRERKCQPSKTRNSVECSRNEAVLRLFFVPISGFLGPSRTKLHVRSFRSGLSLIFVRNQTYYIRLNESQWHYHRKQRVGGMGERGWWGGRGQGFQLGRSVGTVFKNEFRRSLHPYNSNVHESEGSMTALIKTQLPLTQIIFYFQSRIKTLQRRVVNASGEMHHLR